LLYKGVIAWPVVAPQPPGTPSTVELAGYGIDDRCVAWGVLVNRPAAYGGNYSPIGYLISWMKPLLNTLSIYFPTNYAPIASQRLFVYAEVYRPVTPIN